MRVSRVFLRWYKSFNIDYTGSAGGDRVPHKKPWNVWKLKGADVELPFVEIPIEPDITTIVGANESGKSHLLSAISHVLSGHGIPGDPFSSAETKGRAFSETDLCHFALPLTKHAGLWPQVGLEFSDLGRDEFKRITGMDSAKSEDSPTIQLFLAPNEQDATFAWLYHSKTDEAKKLTEEEYTTIRDALPDVRFINSQLPLADEIHIADLLRGYGESGESVKEREPFFDFRLSQVISRWIFGSAVPSPSTTTPKDFADQMATYKNQLSDSSKRAQQKVHLEVQLFRDVLGIPKSALLKLYQLSDDAKSSGDALVAKWSEELERVLNLSRYWQQDQDFSIRLTHHKGVISLEIKDKTQKTYMFRERSSGLRYFLSYYIQAKAIEKTSTKRPIIILMDEPDSFLSIAGQRNLLAVFESLIKGTRSNLQLVYTTHSPFLIHRNFPRRIRLVRKGDGEEGTQLVDKARERRFEPIRSALGIDLSQTLFMGPVNIVTEGPTDQYFISESIRFFAQGVPASDLINLNEVVVVSGESASGVYKLIAASKWADEIVPTAIAILDNDEGGRTERDRLIGRARGTAKVLDESNVILVSAFLETAPPRDSTTEDLVPTSLFVEAVRRYIDRWLREEAAAVDGWRELLTDEQFEKIGHAPAARAVFAKIRGFDKDYDKLGVFEQVFELLHVQKPDEHAISILRGRVIGLCQALRARIEASTRAQRQQTGVQAVKRLISDFLIQHQATPPPTLDLELRLGRIATEANAFGADDGAKLVHTLTHLSAEARSIRQGGRTDLSESDWMVWRERLDAIARNPLDPSSPLSGTAALEEVGSDDEAAAEAASDAKAEERAGASPTPRERAPDQHPGASPIDRERAPDASPTHRERAQADS